MAGSQRAGRVGDDRRHWRLFRSRELNWRAGVAGADAAGVSGEFFVPRGGPKTWGPSSDGAGCVERALADGPLTALDDRPRRGKELTITAEAKAWLVSLPCNKVKDHGYPHELWTTRLLARHAREHGPAVRHQCLANLVQGTVCKILGKEEIKPHKVRYKIATPGSNRRWRRFCASIVKSKS